ncbi:MAG: toxin-antitoxin system protein [Chloroflexi bacterium]|nr:toxin-antitoxin system protein [Chloroflexota bacterium]
MAETTTVRVSQKTRDVLQQLARQSNEPMQLVLSKAVEAYRRRWVLEQTNRAYAALKVKPELWAEETKERRAWEQTLADGLEGDQ